MTVELLAHSGKPLVVTAPGLTVNGTPVGGQPSNSRCLAAM